MRQRVIFLFLAIVGLIGAIAPSATAAANPEHTNCLALFVSNEEPGEVGASASSNARDPEAHPFGLNVISFTAHLSAAECGE